MPAVFKLDPSKRMVYSRSSGILADEDLLGHIGKIRDLFEQGVLDSSWAQIMDFTATTELAAVTSEGIRLLAAQNPWPRESIRVVIAPTNEVFGLTRMYQLLGDLD